MAVPPISENTEAAQPCNTPTLINAAPAIYVELVTRFRNGYGKNIPTPNNVTREKYYPNRMSISSQITTP